MERLASVPSKEQARASLDHSLGVAAEEVEYSPWHTAVGFSRVRTADIGSDSPMQTKSIKSATGSGLSVNAAPPAMTSGKA